MKTVSKKLLSLLLVVLLLAAAVPFQAFATEAAAPEADAPEAEKYQVKVIIRNADGNGKLGEVTLDATTEKPVTKVQIDTAVTGKVGDDYSITKYYKAAGSEELTLTENTDTLPEGVLEITVVVQSNTPPQPDPVTYVTLHLDANGGTISSNSAATADLRFDLVNGEASVSNLPTASKSGYTFDGWYTAEDKKIENGTKLTADTTATAKYVLNTKNLLVKGVKTTELLEKAKLISEYNVALNTPLLDFVKGSDVVAAVQASVPAGYQLKNNNGSILWYNFSGNALTAQDQATNVAQTVLVKYEPKTFKITFKPNGGTVGTDSWNVTYDAKIGVDPTTGKSRTLPIATKTGDVFLGWFDENGVQYTADTVYKVNGDTVLTAKWQKESSVLLRIYLNNNKTTADRIVDITGKVTGNSVTQSEVEKIVKTYYQGSNMQLVGLFNDASWADYKAGNITKGDPNVTIQDDAKTTNVYVVVKNATNKPDSTNSTTKPATKPADKDNPKTGDTVMIYVASAAMAVAAVALIAVQLLRKKKQF